MEIVSFLSIEDEDKDLILSFAVPDPDCDGEIQSMILMRTPVFEVLVDEDLHGVQVSHQNYPEADDEFLEEVRIEGTEVRITSSKRQYLLNLRRIEDEDIEAAIRILNQMNFDDRFRLEILGR